MQKVPLLSGREVARGTLRSLIARADLTIEEFLNAMN